MREAHFRRVAGFTLIELIVTMIIIGIMAYNVMPRFTSAGAFDARGAADQMEAYIRFAQKSALAGRRMVRVQLSSTASIAPVLCITTDTNCATACSGSYLSLPGNFAVGHSTVTIVGASNFCFNTLGGTNAQQTITFKDGADVIRTITVETGTGYVHSS